MDLTIKINLDNDAFAGDDSGPEIEFCLLRVIDLLGEGEDVGPISDSNGNKVGYFRIK